MCPHLVVDHSLCFGFSGLRVITCVLALVDLKFPRPTCPLKHTFPAENPLPDSHMSCFTLTFFDSFISFSHMPNGLSFINCKFFDKMTFITAALMELSSSILCHVKLFLLFCSLLVLNLFWLLLRRPSCCCLDISGSIMLERDRLTWGFATTGNLLERILKKSC